MQKEIKKCGCAGCKNQSVLTFKDEHLWQRFNQFVARERGWLPGEQNASR